MCPYCHQQVRCISAARARKKLYLCDTCQKVLHQEQLDGSAPEPHTVQPASPGVGRTVASAVAEVSGRLS